MNACTSKGWFLRHRKRIAEIGVGMTLYAIFNWLFNYPLYIWVIDRLGLLSGGLTMTLLSLIQCALFLVIFDRMGIDWVGVTYVDDAVKKEKKGWVERLVVWAVRKEHQTLGGRSAKFAGFVVMSVLVDPFVIAVHYRRQQFSGVTRRDWLVLVSAVLIANIYWTLRTGILVAIFLKLWGLTKHHYGY